LREPTARERSQFLHRLQLLGIAWGRKSTAVMGKGTFREEWLLAWKPEFAFAIVDAARFGNTVEAAAAGAIAAQAPAASLDALCSLLEQTLLADLPPAASLLLDRIAAEASRGDDVLRLVRAVPALARLARYGSVRQTDASAVGRILDGLSARIHVGLASAVAGIDDDQAAAWRPALGEYHQALGLVESVWREDWRAVLARLLAASPTHPLIAGTAAQLLFGDGHLSAGEVGRELGLALSRGQEPARAAAWIEGFLTGHGTLLVHDPRLLPLLEDWVAALSEDAFLAVLPLVRRTFATFPGPERAKIAQRLGRPRAAAGAAPSEDGWSLHAERAAAVLPVVRQLLGRPPSTPPTL